MCPWLSGSADAPRPDRLIDLSEQWRWGTMFHGWWWQLASAAGPFDVAFLPINGAVVNFPWRQPPSPYPAAMTAEDAVIAGRLLGARVTVPTHFGGFDLEPYYPSASDAFDRFVSAASRHQLSVGPSEPGEVLEVGALTAGWSPA